MCTLGSDERFAGPRPPVRGPGYTTVMSSRLASAWSTVAEGYDAYWVPRFRPWVVHVVEALGALPPGPIAVPCCGSGAELSLLATRYPDREIVGIDLSAGMATLARRHASGRVRIVVEDASHLSGQWAGIASCFGLQQLPDPPAALARWCGALLPGGRLSVVFWTLEGRDEGPFDALRASTDRLLGRKAPTWSHAIPGAVSRAATLLSDTLVSFPIHHDSPETFWHALTERGPWKARQRQQPDVVAEIGEQFLSQWPPGPIHHTPHARVVLAAARRG